MVLADYDRWRAEGRFTTWAERRDKARNPLSRMALGLVADYYGAVVEEYQADAEVIEYAAAHPSTEDKVA